MAEQNDKIVLSGYQKRNLKDNPITATKEMPRKIAELKIIQ